MSTMGDSPVDTATSLDGLIGKNDDEAYGLQWIDHFLDELAVDSCSSGSGYDNTDHTTTSDSHLLDAILMGTTQHSMLTHAERKKHHRESMARLRRERRTRIGRLDAQEKRLHQQLRRALAFFERHEEAHAAPQECRCKTYVVLVREAERLLQEQYALEQQRHAWKRYIKLVTVESERTSETTPRTDDGTVRREEAPLLYVGESVESCEIVVGRALREIAQAKLQLSDLSIASADCLGWQAQRSFAGKVLQCRFVRRLACDQSTTLRDLQQRTWDLLHTSGQVAQLLGSHVEVSVVQTVDADAFITRSRVPESSACFCLNARKVSERDGAVTLIVAKLDKTRLLTATESQDARSNRSQRTHGVWVLKLAHVKGECSGEQISIEIECTTVVECESAAHAARRAVECCTALLRWGLDVTPRATQLLSG